MLHNDKVNNAKQQWNLLNRWLRRYSDAAILLSELLFKFSAEFRFSFLKLQDICFAIQHTVTQHTALYHLVQ